jgi:hypothetical protein
VGDKQHSSDSHEANDSQPWGEGASIAGGCPEEEESEPGHDRAKTKTTEE